MGIRARLLLLVIGAAIPLAALGLFALRNEWDEGRSQLNETVEQKAELAAVALAVWLEAQKEPLTALASGLAQAGSEAEMQRYLQLSLSARPHWLDLRVYDETGAAVISQPEEAHALPHALIQRLLNRMNTHDVPAIETDWSSDVAPRALVAAVPVGAGRSLVTRFNSSSVESLFADVNLPAHSVVTVLDPQRRIVYRSRASEQFLGASFSGSALISALGDGDSATVETESPADGTPRIYGVARAGDTGFLVTVGTDTSALYRPARAKLMRFALFSIIALLLTVSVALILARSIARPLRRLNRAANEIGAGASNVSAPEDSGVAEIARLGAAFNRMAAQVREREQHLKELDRLKSEFVSGVSHELRTPLTTIKTLTRVLQRDGGDEASRRRYLETIAAQCDRQIDLVLNLLDVSRIESGALHIEPGRVDVAEMVRACVRVERAAAELREMELRAEVNERLPPVRADHGPLRRALCALVDNAIKYTPEGGRVTVTAEEINDRIEFIVTDTGRGIAHADLPHIFEKFYRGRPPTLAAAGLENETAIEDEEQPVEMHGVGLGLYLVRNIVEQMKGSVSVSSEPGRGSRFVVSLPVWRDEAETRRDADRILPPENSAAHGDSREVTHIGQTLTRG